MDDDLKTRTIRILIDLIEDKRRLTECNTILYQENRLLREKLNIDIATPLEVVK